MEKIEAIDLEIGNIIFVDEEHGFCEIIDIGFSFYGPLVFTLTHTDLTKPSRSFTKNFKPNRKIEII